MSMIRKYHNHILHTNPRHRKEESQKNTVTKNLKDNKSKATSSLFIVKIIARLERTQRNEYQNKHQHRTPQTTGGTYNNRSTTTEPLS